MNKSESIKNLAGALATFQSEVTNPANSKKVSAGKFSYKYAPLDEILNSVRPLLSKNGLSILQAPTSSEGYISVSTILLHSSGEYIELDPITLKMDKITAQGAGSAITYARRYALSAVLGIASEDDDDANSIEPDNTKQFDTLNTPMNKNYQKPNKNLDKDKQAIIDNSLATESQIEAISKLAKERGLENSMVGYIKSTYGKEDFKALTRQEAGQVMRELQR